VRVRAQGFVSEYLWGVGLAAGRSWSVGTLPLRRGASVSGWVRAGDARVPEGCSVTLSLPTEASDSTERGRRSFSARSRVVGHEGFFHIPDVSPGRYLLSVRHPDYAPLDIFPVPVEEGIESALTEPLVLEAPLDLHVAVLPESDPGGGRWEVGLSRSTVVGGKLEPTPMTPSDRAGEFLARGLPKGKYVVHVEDTSGSTWAREELFLEPGSTEFAITVQALRVRGSVRLGTTPVAAELSFNRSAGGAAITLHSDDNGEFSGVLTEGGSWDVRVRASGPQVVAKRTVQVEPIDGQATVDLRLPDTGLDGLVVDEQGGQPVDRAAVTITSLALGRYDSLRSGSDGRFQARGMEPGTWTLAALAGDERASEPATVTLAEGLRPAQVRLVVRSRRVLRGTVTASSGPVPMVEVLGVARDERGRANPLDIARAATRLDGQFELSLPSAAKSADLVLLPPRHALEVMRLALPATGPVVLPVSEAGGVLAAEWLAADGPSHPRLVVWSNGVALDPTLLSDWALSHGGQVAEDSMEIPMLAPGAYEACLLAPGQLAALMASPAFRPGGCAHGTLEPLGRLSLRPSLR